MDEPSIPALVGVLADPEAEVRIQALLALACDQCKQGSCRPAAAAVLPAALALLALDQSPRVRAMAIEVTGAWAHTHAAAAAAAPRGGGRLRPFSGGAQEGALVYARAARSTGAPHTPSPVAA